MNEIQSADISNKEYRHGLVNAQIEIDLPLQLRALRKQRGWTQPELAERTGMKQPRFPVMEKPGGARFTLETLRRIAEAFDVALLVRFAPFTELLDWSNRFNPETFNVPSFQDELDQQGLPADAHPNVADDAKRLISNEAVANGNAAPEIYPFRSHEWSGVAKEQGASRLLPRAKADHDSVDFQSGQGPYPPHRGGIAA